MWRTKEAESCARETLLEIIGLGLSCGFSGRIIWIVDAHRDDGRRFIVRVDEKLSAFVELERQVLTVTFYLESIRRGDQ
jgi:hypothetical protein